MRSIGRITLTWAAVFLLVMAVLINSPALFYMSTAIITLLLISRLQAWLSVRGLKFERVAPPAVVVGERVTVTITVMSLRRLKRPLVSIIDNLPERLFYADRTPSLPIAPAFDQPIASQYSFRSLKRGRYRWNSLTAEGTDALGLVTMSKKYMTEPSELTVYPAPVPVSIALRPAQGWGISELESGKFRGSGIEPRGIREYSEGDPLRYVHWASSARSGTLMVKEFEAGSGLCTAFIPQRTRGTEVGTGAATTLEAMAGHLAYLSEQYIRKGATVLLPTLEVAESTAWSEETRKQEIYELLALMEADETYLVSGELEGVRHSIPEGTALYVLLSTQDPMLPGVLARMTSVQKVCLIYDLTHYEDELKQKRLNAADPGYLHNLRTAGAEVIIMPAFGGVV